LEKDEKKRMMKKFYRLDEEEESDGSASEEESEGEDQLEYDPARGIGVASSSEESEEDDEEDEEEEEEEEKIETEEIEEDIPMGDATSRLAAVNLDWDNIRAVDILAVLQSFIPRSSQEVIRKVTIYPSEFGKQRLKSESLNGPAIFTSDKPTQEGEDDVDTAALRKYQLERLRYYYAIIECSSISIANHLYKALDGAELGATANLLDLRFVPDSVTFDDSPKDEALSLSDEYEPVEFVTDALQHSKPKLTWDAEDPERKRLISEAFKRESENGKWDALLASSEEDEEEEENEDLREKYRSLLLGVTSSNKKEEAEDEDDWDGLETSAGDDGKDATANLSRNEEPEDETTIEKYMRKERERKHRRREEKLARKLAAAGGEPEDLGFDDPFFSDNPDAAKRKQKEEKKRAKKEAEDEVAQKATELELLVQDEENQAGNHFNINHILKSEKKSKHKKKKKRDAEKEQELQENFKMDLNDPRFADVYQGGEFAIDPNSSAFRKGLRGMEAVLEESRRRKRDADGTESTRKKKKKQR